jgi:hypothetical protein
VHFALLLSQQCSHPEPETLRATMQMVFKHWLQSHQTVQQPALREAIDLVCRALNAPA